MPLFKETVSRENCVPCPLESVLSLTHTILSLFVKTYNSFQGDFSHSTLPSLNLHTTEVKKPSAAVGTCYGVVVAVGICCGVVVAVRICCDGCWNMLWCCGSC